MSKKGDKYIEEKRCTICNKIFIPAPMHAYRISEKGRLVCSYHCMLESDRRRAMKRKYTKLTKRSNEK